VLEVVCVLGLGVLLLLYPVGFLPRVGVHPPLCVVPCGESLTSGEFPVGVGGCGRNPLAGVRLLPPAGYAVVGALLRCPLPLDLLRSLLDTSAVSTARNKLLRSQWSLSTSCPRGRSPG
jgi:hypothetical protein